MKIPISKLRFDLKNSRFVSASNQDDALNKLIFGDGEKASDKVYNLAKDISISGLSPLEQILVLPVGDIYQVMEGNRRLAAISGIKKPNRIEDERLRNKFDKLKFTETEVNCHIASNTEECFKLMEYKHMGEQNGVGAVHWGAVEKGRHKKRRGKKVPKYLQMESFLQNNHPDMLALLKSFPSSTFERIFSSKFMRGQLGLEYKNGYLFFIIQPEESFKAIKRIITDFGSGICKVDHVKTQEKIKDYYSQPSHKTV